MYIVLRLDWPFLFQSLPVRSDGDETPACGSYRVPASFPDSIPPIMVRSPACQDLAGRYGTLWYIIHACPGLKSFDWDFGVSSVERSLRSPRLQRESSLRDLHARAVGSLHIVGTEFILSTWIITTNQLRAVGLEHLNLWVHLRYAGKQKSCQNKPSARRFDSLCTRFKVILTETFQSILEAMVLST